MRFTTITAKFNGRCKRCKTAILAGSRIRYGGPGMTYHLAADCPTAADSGAAAIRVAAVTARAGRPKYDSIGAWSAAARRRARANTGRVTRDFPITLPAGSVDANGDAILPAPIPDRPDSREAAWAANQGIAVPAFPNRPKLSLMEMAAALDGAGA